MKELLERYFLLRDHPFLPDGGRLVSPDKALNAFDDTAYKYFDSLQAFAKAITEIEQFFANQLTSLTDGTPPALMILGPSGSGRNTMAAVAAQRLRAECVDKKLTTPSYSDISDSSDDPARFLERIRQKVMAHYGKYGADCKPILDAAGTLNPSAPSRPQLESIFESLAEITPKDLPLNVIAIGPIHSKRESWMLDFRKLLAPLRVMPVFYTNDSTVAATFDGTPEQHPCLTVEIFKLDPADAALLLRSRFSKLELPDRNKQFKDVLFPYSDVLINRLFPHPTADVVPRVNIKYVLTVCSAAFDAKVNQLRRFTPQPAPAPAAPGMLSFAEIETAIRQTPGWRS